MDSLIVPAGEWSNVEMVENIDARSVLANVDAALALGLPELDVLPPTDIPVCICGGGPSLAGDIPQIIARWKSGQHVWALNGTHDYLTQHDIIPHAAWLVDSRMDNVRFYRNPSLATRYYIAARCHPDVFSALKGYPVILWHDASARHLVKAYKVAIGGGTTIGVKAMAGAYTLGFREMHMFGYDSSYSDDTHHAYPMPMNDGETVLDVDCGGRQFRAAPWMVNQCKNFGTIAPALQAEGCELHIHGDGLLPWIATSGHRLEKAA